MPTIKISFVVPVYNEQASVKRTIAEIKAAANNIGIVHEIVVIDDASSDNSRKILENIDGIKLLSHPYNSGYGASLRTGIRNSSYEWILIIDADATYPVNDIQLLVNYAGDYDMVIGARKSFGSISFMKRLAKFIITKLSNFVTKRNIPDINSGFRLFRKEPVMRFMSLFPDGFSFTTTLTLVFLTNGYKVKYIPIAYFKRVGQSKAKPFDVISFVYLIITTITFFKPMRVFSVLSILLFMFAASVFLGSYLFLGRVLDMTIAILLLASLQTFILGLIADLIIKTRK
jgi:glycosyltransferase involved in cell wall biosynthesis